MLTEADLNDLLGELRRQAVLNPKQARLSIRSLLDGEPEVLQRVLNGAAGAGDGRLRQAIAMVYKNEPDTGALEPWLQEWRHTEPDEFTRSAIEAAIASRLPAPPKPVQKTGSALFVDAYRYVAERLCHRVRNPLGLPSSRLPDLKQIIGEVSDEHVRQQLIEIVADLQTGLQKISRTVEFDIGDDYLTWRDIVVVDWIMSAVGDMNGRYGNASLDVACDPTARKAKVRTNLFLLDTLFGNLWANAIQASDAPHTIRLEISVDLLKQRLVMVVSDSGPGFSDAYVETAFQAQFSTKSTNRGRGLMEIADAVTRMQGEVSLVKMPSNDYRVRIILPLETQ